MPRDGFPACEIDTSMADHFVILNQFRGLGIFFVKRIVHRNTGNRHLFQAPVHIGRSNSDRLINSRSNVIDVMKLIS